MNTISLRNRDENLYTQQDLFMLDLFDFRARRASRSRDLFARLARFLSTTNISITWFTCSLAKQFEQYACYDAIAYRRYWFITLTRNIESFSQDFRLESMKDASYKKSQSNVFSTKVIFYFKLWNIIHQHASL